MSRFLHPNAAYNQVFRTAAELVDDISFRLYAQAVELYCIRTGQPVPPPGTYVAVEKLKEQDDAVIQSRLALAGMADEVLEQLHRYWITTPEYRDDPDDVFYIESKTL